MRSFASTLLVTLGLPATVVGAWLLLSAARAEQTPALRPVAVAGPLAFVETGRFRAGGAITGPVGLAPAGGLYVAAHDGFLYALDAQLALRWKRDLGAPAYGGVLVSPAGDVYVGTDGQALWSYDSQGNLRFRVALAAAVETTPAWSHDGKVVVCAGREVVAVRSDGAISFRYRGWGKFFASPVIDPEGGVYVGSHDGNFYALSPDGAERFRVYGGAAVDSDAVLGPGGQVFFADVSGRVRGIDMAGHQRWVKQLGSPVRAPLTLGPAGEVLGVTQGPRVRLFALAPASGQLLSDQVIALTDAEDRALRGGVRVDGRGRRWLAAPDDQLWMFDGPHGAARVLQLRAALVSLPRIGASGHLTWAEISGDVVGGRLAVIPSLLP